MRAAVAWARRRRRRLRGRRGRPPPGSCTQDLWDETRDSSRDRTDSTKFDEVKPRKLGGEQGVRGLVTVTLTGPQLVEYLRKLDHDAHPGRLNTEHKNNGPLARRMYNALAPVVDGVKPGQTPAVVPQAVVDDAAVSAGSPPSPALARPRPPRPPRPRNADPATHVTGRGWGPASAGLCRCPPRRPAFLTGGRLAVPPGAAMWWRSDTRPALRDGVDPVGGAPVTAVRALVFAATSRGLAVTGHHLVSGGKVPTGIHRLPVLR
ncbi:hypothetical protein SSPS47_33850 [Streptomyces sp. S4.7]|nr:hypothetical protein SSPS47_33850 [Streptomyces sp. S4.7]